MYILLSVVPKPFLAFYHFLVHSFSRDLLATLWPRFNHILELNITSVRETDPQRLGNIDTRPHYVRGTEVASTPLAPLMAAVSHPTDHPPLCRVLSSSCQHQPEPTRGSGLNPCVPFQIYTCPIPDLPFHSSPHSSSHSRSLSISHSRWTGVCLHCKLRWRTLSCGWRLSFPTERNS